MTRLLDGRSAIKNSYIMYITNTVCPLATLRTSKYNLLAIKLQKTMTRIIAATQFQRKQFKKLVPKLDKSEVEHRD